MMKSTSAASTRILKKLTTITVLTLVYSKKVHLNFDSTNNLLKGAFAATLETFW